ALQDEGECFFFIADYHALTTVQDPSKLRGLVQGVALDYLALGLDPEKTAFFRQSDVPEVTELAWILSTVTGMGLLERAHPDKDNVFALYSLFASPEERDALAQRYRAGGLGYGDAKKMLIPKIDETFASARERRRELQKDPERVEAVLRGGAEKANAVANRT